MVQNLYKLSQNPKFILKHKMKGISLELGLTRWEKTSAYECFGHMGSTKTSLERM